MPLAAPDHLTHADIVQAARVLLQRYQDGAYVEWHQQRTYGNDHLRTFLDRSPDARFEPVYAQEVLLAFTPDIRPKKVILRLNLMGLQAGMVNRSAAHPESDDDDLLAGLHLLERQRWFVTMSAERMSPTWVLHLIDVLGAETVDLAFTLDLSRDWFTAAEADPTSVDLPALRTMASLRGRTNLDFIHDVLDLADSFSMPTGTTP